MINVKLRVGSIKDKCWTSLEIGQTPYCSKGVLVSLRLSWHWVGALPSCRRYGKRKSESIQGQTWKQRICSSTPNRSNREFYKPCLVLTQLTIFVLNSQPFTMQVSLKAQLRTQVSPWNAGTYCSCSIGWARGGGVLPRLKIFLWPPPL